MGINDDDDVVVDDGELANGMDVNNDRMVFRIEDTIGIFEH